MFNLYRKVLDNESDSEERESLKTETVRHDEPEDPRFKPLTQAVVDRPRGASMSAPQSAPPLKTSQPPGRHAPPVHFDPFSQATSLPPEQQATSSREPPPAMASTSQGASPANGLQQHPSPRGGHSFNDIIITAPQSSANHMAQATQGSAASTRSHTPALAAPLHPSASAPSLPPPAPSAAPQFETLSFRDILNQDTRAGSPASETGPIPAASTTASTADDRAAGYAAATTAAAPSSDPCFIRESDWDLLGSLAPASAAAAAPASAAAAPAGTEPSAASQGWAQLEDLFEGVEGASAPMPASASSAAMQAEPSPAEGSAPRGEGMPEKSADSGPMGEAPGQFIEPRELLIYAIPLIKDRLVFLPVTAWQMDPEAEKQGFTGAVKSGFGRVTGSVSNWWSSLKEKDPDSLGHKVHKHGTGIMENMSAEERLMQNIPRNAQKLVIHHPASIDPSEVQEQLSKMTSTYCVKSVGKAAVAGVILPVAVGLEILAVPGAGWIALYHLYKSSVSAAGGQRLKSYLNKGNDVRVNFAGDPRLDKYVERVDNSTGGVLGDDDIEELCHDVQEASLNHPLTELRNRFIRRHINHKDEYAQLPDEDSGAQEPASLFLGKGSDEGEAGKRADGQGGTRGPHPG